MGTEYIKSSPCITWRHTGQCKYSYTHCSPGHRQRPGDHARRL